MTIAFRCNGCDTLLEFHDQRGVLFYGDDRDLRKDLCSKCYEAVSFFIDEIRNELKDDTDTDTDQSLRFKKVNRK